MATRFDICTPRPKKDGGSYWVKIGSAWQGDKGIQLVFDALPIPDSEGRCVANLFEPREQGDNPRGRSAAADRQQSSARSNAGFDDLDGDHVPF
jgi:hypothetical protein